MSAEVERNQKRLMLNKKLFKSLKLFSTEKSLYLYQIQEGHFSYLSVTFIK